MTKLKEEVTTQMSQSEFLEKIGVSAAKAFLTTIIIVAGIIKLLDLIDFYGFIALGQILLFTSIVISYYYYYFWSGRGNREAEFNEKGTVLTWKDFFYTTKISSDNNFTSLATSWTIGGLTYCGVALVIYSALFCIDNSDSEATMSLMRLCIIFTISTIVYIYTQRYALRKSVLGTVGVCILYGFGLTISTYLLGMVVGLAGMVFGTMITVTILVLQFSFTSMYTYMDLLEWSKATHLRIIRDAERLAEKLKKEKEEAKKEGGEIIG